MQILVRESDVVLVDADQFDDLRVVVSIPIDRAAAALAERSIGELDVESSRHVWLRPPSLIDIAGPVATDEWRSSFGQMLKFASAQGWMDDDGRVRAHVERSLSVPELAESFPQAAAGVPDGTRGHPAARR